MEDNKEKVSAVPDGGYGWVIVGASFMIHFLLMGIQYSYGIYLRYYIEVQYANRASSSELALIGSLASALLAIGGIVAGPLSDRFGYRTMAITGCILFSLGYLLASFCTEVWQLFITQGVMVGLGSSIGFFPAVSIPSQWFDKKRGLATGICVAGSGIGGLVFSPFTQFMIDSVGIAWCQRITSLIVLVLGCFFSCFLRERIPASRYQGLNLARFKDPKFLVLWCGGFISCLGYLIPFFLITLYATSQGVSPTQASILLGTLNGCNAVGRIILGGFADKLGKFNVMALGTMSSGLICLLVWPFATTFPLLMLFSIICGFTAGALVSLLPVISAHLFGTTNLASTNGLLYLSTGLATLLGAPISTALVTYAHYHHHNLPYLPVILFAGISGVAGGCLLLVLKKMAVPFWKLT